MLSIPRARRVVLSAVFATVLASCGADGDGQANLPAAAVEGRSIARSKGCAACHGHDGEGGVGPTFVGLFGSEVQIQGGPSVVADRKYLAEAIVEPSAEIVEPYTLLMPKTKLSADEVDSLIAYIEALAVVEQ
jgi:cytochrome c oxidase subunit II